MRECHLLYAAFYLQMKILIIKLAIIKLLNVSFENFFNETILTRS